MTVSKIEKSIDVNEVIESVFITFICPTCKTQKKLKFPKTVFDHKKNLNTISIPGGLVCKHPFQAFVDKNFKIRGYQKVDFEFGVNPTNFKPYTIPKRPRDELLFQNLITEGNYVEYYPKKLKDKEVTVENALKKAKLSQNPPIRSQITEIHESSASLNPNNKLDYIHDVNKKHSLKEIYEDFWEFIENDNETFREYIINDPRRKLY